MLAPALLEKRLKGELAALQKANKACFNCFALVRSHSVVLKCTAIVSTTIDALCLDIPTSDLLFRCSVCDDITVAHFQSRDEVCPDELLDEVATCRYTDVVPEQRLSQAPVGYLRAYHPDYGSLFTSSPHRSCATCRTVASGPL